MNIRKVMIGLMAAALVGSFGGAAQNIGAGEAVGSAASFVKGSDATDEIVEGHTVYQKIDQGGETEQAAIAVLIENETKGQVLWFDDSFLHQPARELACGGSVWATHSQGVLLPSNQYTADKTYSITSPAENNAGTVTWTITEFEGPDNSPLTRAWAVEVDCFATNPDEGYLTGPFPTYCGPNGGVDDCSVDGDPATDANSPSDVGELEYNALLWFEFGFGHLGPVQQFVEPAQFGCENTDDGDGDGTNDGTADSPCGADAETHDTTEGNSHPYNPDEAAEADGGEPAPIHSHSTAQIDLYYLEEDNVDHGTVDFTNNLGGFHEHGD